MAPRHLPACLRPSPPRRLGPSLRRRLEPLDPLTHPLLLLSLLLRTSGPNGAAATDADCRSHRAPHASPTPQGALPRPPPSSPPTHGPPEALQRRHHRRSVAGHRSSPPSIRRTPCLPCLASSTRRTAVSPRPDSPSPRAPPPSLASPTTLPENPSPPAMAPSRPQPSPLAYEPANALSASEGAQITQLLLLPCSVAWFPSIAELQQPQRGSPPAAPATPAAVTCLFRCAFLPGTRRSKPHVKWCSVASARCTSAVGRGRRRRHSGDCRRGTPN